MPLKQAMQAFPGMTFAIHYSRFHNREKNGKPARPKGAGTNYATIGKYTGKGIFTIAEVKAGKGSTAGWGRLKSGAGWISLDYATRI